MSWLLAISRGPAAPAPRPRAVRRDSAPLPGWQLDPMGKAGGRGPPGGAPRAERSQEASKIPSGPLEVPWPEIPRAQAPKRPKVLKSRWGVKPLKHGPPDPKEILRSQRGPN